jgi:hypothetical protein
MKDYVCRMFVGDIGKFCTGYFKQSEVCAEMAYWIDVIRVSSMSRWRGNGNKLSELRDNVEKNYTHLLLPFKKSCK